MSTYDVTGGFANSVTADTSIDMTLCTYQCT